MTQAPEPTTPHAAGSPVLPGGMQGQVGPLFRLIKDQRIAFLIVGGINTGLGTVWFVLFELLFGENLGRFGYIASLVCAYVAAIICAFLLYRYIVFRVRGNFWVDLARFSSVYLVTLGINLVALPALVEATGWRPIWAQFLIAGVTAFGSYFGHKYFSFRRAADAPARPHAEEPLNPNHSREPEEP